MLWKIIYKEMIYRKWEMLLTLLAVTGGVTLFTLFFTLTDASNTETIRLTRDMGFNLRIIPGKTEMSQFWLTGYSREYMPENYLDEFMKHKDFSFAHVTATLHKKIILQNREVILTGLSKEIEPSGKQKSPMIFSIENGTVYIGHEISKSFNKAKGDFIKIKNKSFKIKKVLTETGRSDDIRIYGTLHEIQEVLNLQDKINEIKALQCLCLIEENTDPLRLIREQLNKVLPDGKVIMDKVIADARLKQRKMIEKYFFFLTPIIILGIGLWIFTFSWLNIRDRRNELGVYHSLGYSSLEIAAIFIFRAFLIGLVGAMIGYFIGSYVTLLKGPEIFKATAGSIKPIYSILFWALCITPAFAVFASLIPILINILKNPADILRNN